MTLSLVLVLSVIISPISLLPAAQAQPAPGKLSVRSGIITLGTGQGFRVTVVNTEAKDIRVRFAWRQYTPASCSGMPSVCRHTVASQGASTPETLGADDALTFDVPATGSGVNVTVTASSPNVRVLGIVFDTSTQRIMSICTFIPD
jgi:hypothetical protein